MLTDVNHRVLLPGWVLTATDVYESARKYIARYEDYELVTLEGCFAICKKR